MELNIDQVSERIEKCYESGDESQRKLIENIGKDDLALLVIKAVKAREDAYAPKSNYFVGAAVLTADGEVYSGWNTEISTYNTVCAERGAISRIPKGKRRLKAIAIMTINEGTPCGTCLDWLSVFSEPDGMLIILANESGNIDIKTLAEKFPYPPTYK